MEWRGDDILAQYEAKARQNVQAACTLVQTRARANIGIQGPPRSTAGNFPHKDTNELHRGVGSQLVPSPLDKPRGVVGTTVKHGAILELTGDPKRSRPWLRRTLEESKPDIVKTLTTL